MYFTHKYYAVVITITIMECTILCIVIESTFYTFAALQSVSIALATAWGFYGKNNVQEL